MTELVELTNDVGGLAELTAPEDQPFRGRLPQGLNHLALIGTALDLFVLKAV